MITKEEELKEEYEKFIQTKEGKAWINYWQKIIGSDTGGDFGNYLYDFYPEMISQEWNIMKKTKIISAFPACGKTYAFENLTRMDVKSQTVTVVNLVGWMLLTKYMK